MSKKEPVIDFNEPHEFVQLWDDMTHKLHAGREAYEYPSVCYVLRNDKLTPMVYRVNSKRLSEKDPKYCEVVDIREVWAKLKESACVCPPEIEGTCANFNSVWTYDQILSSFVSESGFDSVEAWLDEWSESIDNLELEKEYKFWLLKIIYPHTNQPVAILNDDARKPIQ